MRVKSLGGPLELGALFAIQEARILKSWDHCQHRYRALRVGSPET